MSKEQITKQQVINSLKKIVSDKELVRSYIKGDITLKKIETKGIKLAKPL